MKAIEFRSQLNADNSLAVPAALADDIPSQCPLRVLVLIPETDEDRQWESLTAFEFGQGYAESDAIYDDLSSG